MQKTRTSHDTETSILITTFVCAVLYFGSLFPAMHLWVPTFHIAIEIGIGFIGFLLFVALLRYLGRPKYMMQRPQQHSSSQQDDRHSGPRYR